MRIDTNEAPKKATHHNIRRGFDLAFAILATPWAVVSTAKSQSKLGSSAALPFTAPDFLFSMAHSPSRFAFEVCLETQDCIQVKLKLEMEPEAEVLI